MGLDGFSRGGADSLGISVRSSSNSNHHSSIDNDTDANSNSSGLATLPSLGSGSPVPFPVGGSSYRFTASFASTPCGGKAIRSNDNHANRYMYRVADNSRRTATFCNGGPSFAGATDVAPCFEASTGTVYRLCRADREEEEKSIVSFPALAKGAKLHSNSSSSSDAGQGSVGFTGWSDGNGLSSPSSPVVEAAAAGRQQQPLAVGPTAATAGSHGGDRGSRGSSALDDSLLDTLPSVLELPLYTTTTTPITTTDMTVKQAGTTATAPSPAVTATRHTHDTSKGPASGAVGSGPGGPSRRFRRLNTAVQQPPPPQPAAAPATAPTAGSKRSKGGRHSTTSNSSTAVGVADDSGGAVSDHRGFLPLPACDETWAFYNDATDCSVRVRASFGTHSELRPLGLTRLTKGPAPLHPTTATSVDASGGGVVGPLPHTHTHTHHQRLLSSPNTNSQQWTAECFVPPLSTQLFMCGQIRGGYRVRCTVEREGKATSSSNGISTSVMRDHSSFSWSTGGQSDSHRQMQLEGSSIVPVATATATAAAVPPVASVRRLDSFTFGVVSPPSSSRPPPPSTDTNTATVLSTNATDHSPDHQYYALVFDGLHHDDDDSSQFASVGMMPVARGLAAGKVRMGNDDERDDGEFDFGLSRTAVFLPATTTSTASTSTDGGAAAVPFAVCRHDQSASVYLGDTPAQAAAGAAPSLAPAAGLEPQPPLGAPPAAEGNGHRRTRQLALDSNSKQQQQQPRLPPSAPRLRRREMAAAAAAAPVTGHIHNPIDKNDNGTAAPVTSTTATDTDRGGLRRCPRRDARQRQWGLEDPRTNTDNTVPALTDTATAATHSTTSTFAAVAAIEALTLVERAALAFPSSPPPAVTAALSRPPPPPSRQQRQRR